MRGPSTLLRASILLIGVLACPAFAGAQNELADVQGQMAEARRHFEGLEYEQVIPPLDRAIATMTSRRSEDTRKTLADAYEMRARALRPFEGFFW